jgi:hypothetical protein
MAATVTIAVRRAELLDLKRLQLAAEIAEGTKPTLSDMIRRVLDAYTAASGTQLWRTRLPRRPARRSPAMR